MLHRKRTLVMAFALLPFPSAYAATYEAGAGRAFDTPSKAIAAAGNGDTVVIYPGQYFDCAIVPQSRLTIEGRGDAAAIVLTDKACGGKGLLVVDGDDVTIRNLTLTRVRVPDGNGAGIRAEGTNLTVDGVRFINNQDGILAGDAPQSRIIVKHGDFEKNGSCKDGCAHGIYVGHVAALQVENSRFFATKEAHHIKSRALRTEITGCTIEDGPDGTASYLIEVPNGGALVVRNTTMEKGPHATNHSAAIVLGAEGVTQPTGEITIQSNDFTNDMPYRTAFVNNNTATEATLHGNHLHGPVDALLGDGTVN